MPLGQPLGPYILTERLGIGGLAEVYRAERPLLDNRLSHAVAIKRLHKHLTANKNAIQHLLDEARIALRLQHPNIAQTYEIDHADGSFFLVMELVQGASLAQTLERIPSLPLPACLFIIREAAAALAYAHTLCDDNGHPLNLIHLDISPDNLLLSHHGHIKLIDFGLASAREQLSSPNSARMRGRAKYLSPERAQGLKFNHQADLFSLGLILFELLTCSHPLAHLDPLQAVAALQRWTPPDLSPWSREWPPSLPALLTKLLAARPSERTADAQSLVNDLSQILHELPSPFDHSHLRDLLNPALPPIAHPLANPVVKPPKRAPAPEVAEALPAVRDKGRVVLFALLAFVVGVGVGVVLGLGF